MDQIDVKDAWKNLNLKTKYYNEKIHVASFALPNYVIDLLEEGKKDE